jgi:hypothetical protein
MAIDSVSGGSRSLGEPSRDRRGKPRHRSRSENRPAGRAGPACHHTTMAFIALVLADGVGG